MKRIGLVALISGVLLLSGCGWLHHKHHKHSSVDIPTDTRLS